MELVHEFTVPVPPRQAFDVLTDIERVAPCMPGATLDSVEGDHFTGRVKVKVGPMQVTYSGWARFTEIDSEGLRARIEAKGDEVRGSGTAGAIVAAELHTREPGTTHVVVRTDLTVTGRPAQFGRGVMEDVGGRLLDSFAQRLEAQLSEPDPSRPPQTTGPSGTAEHDVAVERSTPPEAIDLLQLAGGPVGRRLVPVAALAVLIVTLWRVWRRGR